MNMKKIFYMIGGCISLGLGTLGAVLPLLPVSSLPSSGSHMFCQKSPGNLCGRKGNDQTDKNQNHGHCDPTYGSGVCHDASGSSRTYCSHWCLGIPCSLLPVWSENHSCTKIRLFKSITVI